MTRMITLTLIVGPLLFLVAAFSPVSRVYAERDVGQKLAIIAADRRGWWLSQALFALGAAVAWAGMALLAIRLRASTGSGLPLTAVAGAGVGMALWAYYVYLRIVRAEDFVQGQLSGSLFVAYSFLTMLALFALGVGMLSLRLPRWLPLVNMGAAVLMAAAFLVFKDLPPFLYYLVTLVDGIALLAGNPV